MTPLLIILFGVHPATAVGTDLLYAAATKGAGIHKTIDWSVVSWLAAGSTPSTALTLLFLSHFQYQWQCRTPFNNRSARHRTRRNRCGTDPPQQDPSLLRRSGW
jgi:hypothetical protein